MLIIKKATYANKDVTDILSKCINDEANSINAIVDISKVSKKEAYAFHYELMKMNDPFKEVHQMITQIIIQKKKEERKTKLQKINVQN